MRRRTLLVALAGHRGRPVVFVPGVSAMASAPVLVSVVFCCVAGAPGPAPADQQQKTAVEQGLKYLASQQAADGSWVMGGEKGEIGVTALCVLAFLSAGDVPGKGANGEVVTKGLRWLMGRQGDDGRIAIRPNREMYEHGLATLALAEADAKAGPELRGEITPKLAKAVALIVKAQRTEGQARGGWRYWFEHRSGSDLSVTGWQVLALRAAREAGQTVPPEVEEQAVEFTRRCRLNKTGRFGYTPSDGDSPSLNATGLWILLPYDPGEELSPEFKSGADYLMAHLPAPKRDYYYYGTYLTALLSSFLDSEHARRTRADMLASLRGQQEDSGAWPGVREGDFGPNYCTALAVLALTVDTRSIIIHKRPRPAKGN